MKTFTFRSILAALLLVVLGTTATPVFADSPANRSLPGQRWNDDGYYRHPGYRNSYRRPHRERYYPRYQQVINPLPCFTFLCFVDDNRPGDNRKPKNGELKVFPDCSTYSWNKRRDQWVQVTAATGRNCSEGSSPLDARNKQEGN
jgi:hypothetical protein